ncbi:MAG: CBS domain-containing protein [Jatrophihabitans sp.]|uniref:CBS domain-containing protein n=1 Tax=Jatrophihabitans sp. TaxID=1932789 RepID=UPI003F81B1F5
MTQDSTPLLPEAAPYRVADVMTTEVVTVRAFAGLKEVARVLRTHRVDAVPVVDGDHRVLGVVSTSDLLLHIARHARVAPRGHRLSAAGEARTKREAMSASLLMTTPPITIGSSATIEMAAELIAQHRVRMLPVVDAQTRLLGVVTRNDLVTIFLRDDAEIAADITARVLRPNGVDAGSALQMDVVNGVVVLAGRAPDAATADRVAKGAGLVIGVVAVRDHIERPLTTG